MGLAWSHRIKEEDPERYREHLDRVREYKRRVFADPEKRAANAARAAAYRAKKSADPAWVQAESARKMESKKRLREKRENP